MTHRQGLARDVTRDLTRGRDLVSRWCDLAERRLEHLTEMYETGRWRLYHSESDFIENIREAKAAVEIWRDLLTREASRDNYPVDLSWLGRGKPVLPFDAPPRRLHSSAPWPDMAEPAPSIAAASPDPIWLARRTAEPEAVEQHVVEEQATTAPVIDLAAFERELFAIFRSAPEPEPTPNHAPEVVLDFAAIQDRYPLLRNVL